MQLRKTIAFAALMFLVATSPQLLAQPTCSGGEKAHQFDFWIGEWNVMVGENEAGSNSIRPILDGCVLQETWSGNGGSKGTSLNFYNPTTKKWHQFWVWKNGTVLRLEGGYKDDKMMMRGESKTPQGQKQWNRITWHKNENGTVRQHWEASTDAGKSWKTLFDGLYKKK